MITGVSAGCRYSKYQIRTPIPWDDFPINDFEKSVADFAQILKLADRSTES